jgi:hypothetical protein
LELEEKLSGDLIDLWVNDKRNIQILQTDSSLSTAASSFTCRRLNDDSKSAYGLIYAAQNQPWLVNRFKGRFTAFKKNLTFDDRPLSELASSPLPVIIFKVFEGSSTTKSQLV